MERLDFPNRITVELTNQCNVSCSFCPRQDVPMEIGFMDMGLYRKIIDEAAQHLPVKLVLFFRGESLLHPHFLQCLGYAKERGIGPIQFASNALALDAETAENRRARPSATEEEEGGVAGDAGRPNAWGQGGAK